MSTMIRHDGPITDLTDYQAYMALGWGNTTPGAPDDDTLVWALDATLASAVEGATDADHVRILEFVRAGESARASYESDRQWLSTVNADTLTILDDIAQTARLHGAAMPLAWRRGKSRVPRAVGWVLRWQRAWDRARNARHIHTTRGTVPRTLRAELVALRDAGV